jgi:hypothetical protein
MLLATSNATKPIASVPRPIRAALLVTGGVPLTAKTAYPTPRNVMATGTVR